MPARTVGPVLDVLLPRRCALCGAAGSGVCEPCAAALPPAPPVPVPDGLDACWALLDYHDPTPALVAEIKYRNHRDALDVVARAMAEFLIHARVPVDALTWAPTSRVRRRHRGYDQARLLARSIGRHAGISAVSTLERQQGGAQTGADRSERLHGPAFTSRADLRGHVVVVDDVRTTGATLSAAGRTLRAAGATRVSGLVLAVRP